MKKILSSFLLCLIFCTAVAGELALADATGGAQLNMMQAAIELSMEQKLDLFMRRLLPTAALQELENGSVDAVIIDSRFVKDLPTVPLAAEALVLYVSSANPGADLTAAQVQEILFSHNPNWKKYNNLPMDIQRIMLKPLSSSGTLVQRVFGNKVLEDEILKVESMSAGFALSNSSSIFFARYYPRFPMELKCLPVNGTHPTSTTIVSGKYPLSLRYVIVYRKKTPALDTFIKFISSEKQRRQLRDAGFFVMLPEITREEKP